MCQNTTAWWILDTTQFQHVLQIIASCKILSLYGKLLTSKKKKNQNKPQTKNSELAPAISFKCLYLRKLIFKCNNEIKDSCLTKKIFCFESVSVYAPV